MSNTKEKYAIEKGPYIEAQGDGLYWCSIVRPYPTKGGSQLRRRTETCNTTKAKIFAKRHGIALSDIPTKAFKIVYGKHTEKADAGFQVKAPIKKNVQVPENDNVENNVLPSPEETSPVTLGFAEIPLDTAGAIPLTTVAAEISEGMAFLTEEFNKDRVHLIPAFNLENTDPVENTRLRFDFVGLSENKHTYKVEYFQLWTPDMMGGVTLVGNFISEDAALEVMEDYIQGEVKKVSLTLLKDAESFQNQQKGDRIRKALSKLSNEDIEVLELKELVEAVTF